MSEETVYHSDKEFKNIDYSEKELRNREFLRCEFYNCNFYKSDLKTNDFEDCTFHNCDFTMANLTEVGLRNVIFKDCKLIGLDFSVCSKYMFSFKGFENCFLDYSTFYGKKLKKTPFTKCSFKETDFSEADFSECKFQKCDFAGAKFENTNLQKSDFITATNIAVDPEYNKIQKAKFSIFQLDGLLHKYNLTIDRNLPLD